MQQKSLRIEFDGYQGLKFFIKHLIMFQLCPYGSQNIHSERIHRHAKKRAHKKRELPLQATRRDFNYVNRTYIIVTKSLQNQSPRRDMKANEGPNLPRVLIHTLLFRSPHKTNNIAHTPAIHEKTTLLPKRQIETELLDHSTSISMTNIHHTKHL